MKAIITTTINTEANMMWEELQKTSSLIHVAAPLLKFTPQDSSQLPEKWDVGKDYHLKLSFFGIIPLGNHTIRLIEINPEKKEIISNEYGFLTKTWNHRIKIEPMDSHNIIYTDEIEIKAGLLTFSVWLFAHFFYRHRQKRWKKLLSQ
jgi:hypothetical protein